MFHFRPFQEVNGTQTENPDTDGHEDYVNFEEAPNQS